MAPLTEQTKQYGVLSKAIMLVFAIFLFVVTFYFLVAINAKIKETQRPSKETTTTVSVSKTGTVYVQADLAVVDLTVTTEAKSADGALTQNRAKASKVLEFLKAQGVQEKDIKTINYNLYPRYEYSKAGAGAEIYPPISDGQRYLVGYDATETIEVKIRELDKIGAITQGAVTAGVTDVGSLNFTVESEDAAKNQARSQAIVNARAEAEMIASGLGVQLGQIVGYTESNNFPYYGMGGAMKSLDSSVATPSAVPVAVGENKVEVTVNITYEIK
ncbi:MAG: SIMPL domain-containing protein [Candidatus Paceibacterota bacterium]